MLTTLLALAASLAAPPVRCGACPTPAQVEWHDLEFYGFIHYTTNTFTDKEWGYGDESPSIFNPTALDANQWAKVARDAGMKALIITAKHHDGFCLWPSTYTEHSVKNSPWRDGKGDVLRELADACKANNLRFGVYLSPWDRNHAKYGSPEYIEYYRNQIKELFANYSPIFEFWLDGANGGDGYYGGAREKRTIDRTTYYDWPTTNRLILDQNRSTIIFSDAGPGCRWVGNEKGYSDETSWQTINLEGMYPGVSHDHLARGDQHGTHWVGVEVDVSIRPGWFYHESENDMVKTGKQLVDIWYDSVGRGANLLLNIPPDRRGLIHENDVKSLMEMRRILDETFTVNLVRGVRATGPIRNDASNFQPDMAVDGDPNSYWTTNDDVKTCNLVLYPPRPITFDVVKIREHIPLGQRVEEFMVEYHDGTDWKELVKGTTIGPRRIIRTPKVTAERVRLRILKSIACPVISDFGVYKQPEE